MRRHDGLNTNKTRSKAVADPSQWGSAGHFDPMKSLRSCEVNHFDPPRRTSMSALQSACRPFGTSMTFVGTSMSALQSACRNFDVGPSVGCRPFRTALRWFVKSLSALRWFVTFLSDPLSALQSTRRVHYGSTRSGGVGRTQGRVHWCRQRPSSGYLNGLPRHCWRVVALRLVGACNRKGWYSAVRLVTMSSDSSWRHRQVFSVGTR